MLWLKTFHIIFMVCWFAGIFYLPRLFVYHAMSGEATVKAQLAIMERKLYRFVTPLALLAVLLGFALVAFQPGYYFSAPWFYAKLALVTALVIYHFICGALLKKLADGTDGHSHVFYRWFNEVPILLLLGIVILVVVKPW